MNDMEKDKFEERCKFYEGKDITKYYDRVEVEKNIIEYFFEKYRYSLATNPHIYLRFGYSGMMDEGYTVAPTAINRSTEIIFYLDLVDASILYTFTTAGYYNPPEDQVEILKCWEILYVKSAWMTLHELTHSAKIVNIFLMDVPHYVELTENTAEMNAMEILRTKEYIPEVILDISYSSAHNAAVMQVDRDILNGAITDYGEYYFETLKYILQAFGGGYYNDNSSKDAETIIQILHQFLFEEKDCAFLDLLNKPEDDEFVCLIKVNGKFLPPSKEFTEFADKLNYIVLQNMRMNGGGLSFKVDEDGLPIIVVTGSFLYKPFIKPDEFLDSLGLSDVYTDQFH